MFAGTIRRVPGKSVGKWSMQRQQPQQTQSTYKYDPEKPETWGKVIWDSMHIIAAGYPDDPTEAEKRSFKMYYENLADVLPCPTCQKHYHEILNQFPLKDSHMVSKESLSRWVISIRNKVSDAIGNTKMYTYAEISRMINFHINTPKMLTITSQTKPNPQPNSQPSQQHMHYRVVPAQQSNQPNPQKQNTFVSQVQQRQRQWAAARAQQRKLAQQQPITNMTPAQKAVYMSKAKQQPPYKVNQQPNQPNQPSHLAPKPRQAPQIQVKQIRQQQTNRMMQSRLMTSYTAKASAQPKEPIQKSHVPPKKKGCGCGARNRATKST